MIRDKVSDILGVRIQGDRWEAYVEVLDREGKFTRKTMLGIIMALCREVEDLEKKANVSISIPPINPVLRPTEALPEVKDDDSLYLKRVEAMRKAREAKKNGKVDIQPVKE